jgi:hypothetical protein
MAKVKKVSSQPKKETLKAVVNTKTYAKPKKLKKDIFIYELIGGYTDRYTNEKKYPVIHTIPSSDIIYDDKTNSQRRIKYVPGEQSIFVDEQSEESLNIKKQPIVFSRGILAVSYTNPLLIEYLNATNFNSSNPNRLKSVNPVFYLIDKGEDAKVSVQKSIKEVEAASVALKMPLEQLLGYARVLGVNVDKSTDEIRYDMMQIAKKDPKAFVEGLDDPRTEYAELFILAKEYNILKSSKSDISWNNGGVICTIPLGVSEVEKATDFFMSEEGDAVYKEVRKRLENII